VDSLKNELVSNDDSTPQQECSFQLENTTLNQMSEKKSVLYSGSYLSTVGNNTNQKHHLEQKHQLLVKELMDLDQSQMNKTRRTKNARVKSDKKDLTFKNK